MNTLSSRYILSLLVLLLLIGAGFTHQAFAAGNPALWKMHTKGDFDTVLSGVKTALEAKQFVITGEENLSKGLENNKQVFGEDKWNTIGFQNATAVHFCSLAFNQEVFNMTMDWSVLCPFKVVLYSMKAKPDEIHIVMIRPTYVLAKDPHKGAKKVGKKIEERIVSAIKEGIGK
jgi:uncharacterized protein (DUF302 family)